MSELNEVKGINARKIFQIPSTMPVEHYRADQGIHGALNLYLFVAFAAILFIFGILFILKAKKQEIESAKRIKLAFGLFGIFYGMCRVFFILMFQDFINPDVNYNLFANIAYSFGMLGLTCIIWALEKAKYQTSYFLIISGTITLITFIGVLLILTGVAEIRYLILVIIMIGTPIAGFFIFLLYIQLIRLSSGVVKKKAFYSLVGFFIMIVGITMDGQFFLAIDAVPLWFKMDIVPIICILGFIMFATNQL